MKQAFLQVLRTQNETQKSYCIATVIRVEGSASARTGSKAVFDQSGINLFGWVGGGCAERYIGEQSVEALRDRRTRIVTADLDDEIFGLGVACGGRMDVFIEPLFPDEEVVLPKINLKFLEVAEFLAASYGWRVRTDERDPSADGSNLKTLNDVVLMLAKRIAKSRGRSGNSLRDLKDLPVKFTQSETRDASDDVPQLTVVGKGRIAEAIASHANLLGWPCKVVAGSGFNPIAKDLVIVASHHAQDPKFVVQAFDAGCKYVAMVGSRKRALEVLAHLAEAGRSDEQTLQKLFIPVGLDIDARTPEEIALSIVSEIIQEKGLSS